MRRDRIARLALLPGRLGRAALAAALAASLMLMPQQAQAMPSGLGQIGSQDKEYARYFDPLASKPLRIQQVYASSRIISGQQSTGLAFKGPNDLFIAANNDVFIADTGNNRVVQLNQRGEHIRTLYAEEGEASLSGPEGVFVTAGGDIYVADTGNHRIAVFAPNGEFKRSFGKPESRFLPDSYYFVPKKMVVDARGGMYIVIEGSYQGMMRLDKDGAFMGFFGSNKATISFMSRIKQWVYTQEQLDKEVAVRPLAVTNVALDAYGFFVTATSAATSAEIKRLNAGGIDQFQGKRMAIDPVDAAVDQDDLIYALDRGKGHIIIYDPDGVPLVQFGGISENTWQKGTLRYPTSIAVNAEREIWVSDNQMNVIQVFQRTAFGKQFLSGTVHYLRGEYEESKADWRAVGGANEMIRLSWQALGKIAYEEGRYRESMAYYKQALDAEGFSDGFWQLRQRAVQDFLPAALGVVILLALLYRFTRSWRRKALAAVRLPQWLARLLGDLRAALRLMLHPYEGFYRLKEQRLSPLTLIVLLVLVAVAKLISLYGTGFIHYPVERSSIYVLREMLWLFAPLATWMLANYLVSTVKDGEGRFSEVAQASVFALMPYVVLSIPIALLSNVLAWDERVLLASFTQIMWVWVAVLFFVMTQVIHQFDFTEALKNVAITVVTIALLWLFGIVMSGLAYNLYNFFYQVYREVLFRGWI